MGDTANCLLTISSFCTCLYLYLIRIKPADYSIYFSVREHTLILFIIYKNQIHSTLSRSKTKQSSKQIARNHAWSYKSADRNTNPLEQDITGGQRHEEVCELPKDNFRQVMPVTVNKYTVKDDHYANEILYEGKESDSDDGTVCEIKFKCKVEDKLAHPTYLVVNSKSITDYRVKAKALNKCPDFPRMISREAFMLKVIACNNTIKLIGVEEALDQG